MKKIAAFLLAHILYGMGHVVSLILHKVPDERDATCDLTYRAYNKLMTASVRVQGWGKASGPWKSAPTQRST